MGNLLEIISWVAALLVLISFLMDNMLWLRVVSLIGSLLWVSYAIPTGQTALVVLNGFLIVIHVFKIHKLLKLNAINKEFNRGKHLSDKDSQMRGNI